VIKHNIRKHKKVNSCSCGNKQFLKISTKGKQISARSIKGKSVIADSIKEAKRYLIFAERQRREEDFFFLYQVPFLIAQIVRKNENIKRFKYIADFVTFSDEDWLLFCQEVLLSTGYLGYHGALGGVGDTNECSISIFDTKGVETPLFQLKRALIWEKYRLIVKVI
jgi:hypothetical protein